MPEFRVGELIPEDYRKARHQTISFCPGYALVIEHHLYFKLQFYAYVLNLPVYRPGTWLVL